MIPVAFGGCAGILHPAEGQAVSGRAVILCEAFGYEALCAQRGMLALARMCAAAGLTTLRFHYPGTGDSAGDEEPGQIDRWIDSIEAAVRYVAGIPGVTEVALCGYRLGGLLAIEAARRYRDICALALLAPVLSGRAYASELLLSGAMVAAREGSVPQDWREILGYRLHASDLDRLRGMNERASRGAGSAPRILLVSPDARPDDLDPAIEHQCFQHLDGLTQHSADVVIPVRTFEACAAWLRQGAPCADEQTVSPLTPVALEVAPGIVETRMYFGRSQPCFGVLTRPLSGRGDRAVLILNSGLNMHTGNGRGGVHLARRLAAAGVAAFRMDLDRIGEAAPESPVETVRYHDLGRVADVKAALDLLQSAGFGRVLLTGICAGAYIGLHAAAAGDGRVRAAVLVNLPYFYIRDEDPAIPLWRRPLALAWRVADLTRAWRAAHGANRRAQLGAPYFRRRYLLGRAMLLLHYAVLVLKLRTIALVNRVVGRDWLVSQEDGLLAAAHASGVKVTLVYSQGDWGLVELNIAHGAQGERLHDKEWAELRLVDGADHTMTSRWMQDIYAEIVEAQLAVLPPGADAGASDAGGGGRGRIAGGEAATALHPAAFGQTEAATEPMAR